MHHMSYLVVSVSSLRSPYMITVFMLNTKILTVFLMLGLHPALKRTRQDSLCPFWQHKCKAEKPPRFRK